MLLNIGKDCTQDFKDARHSAFATTMIDEFVIGKIEVFLFIYL